jgi:hypothetical protein
MSREQIFKLLEVAAVLAFFATQALLYLHYGHVQEIAGEEGKARWLARRDLYNYLAAAAAFAAVGMFVARIVFRRRGLNPETRRG